MLQPHGTPLDLLQQVHVFLMLGTPDLNTVFQARFHENIGAELPASPSAHATFDAAQNMVVHSLFSHFQQSRNSLAFKGEEILT